MRRPAQPHLPTRFLDVWSVAGIVRHQGVAATLQGMADAIQADFLRWQEFDKSARFGIHSDFGVIELMPVADQSQYAFKYVNGHPTNHLHGLPTVMAFGALADAATGRPHFLSELTLTTALRTAATSAVAARALARSDSRSMALIGNGAQSEFQALAFHHLLGVREIRLYDIDPAATRRLMANLVHVPGLRLVRAPDVATAVRGADIVTTVTADQGRATVLQPGMVEAGMHLNAVGGDCPGKTELHPDIVRAAHVFVEYEPQTRIEGEIQQMAPDFPVTGLWQVLRGEAPGRADDTEVTLFDSVGFALEDLSALRYMQGCAERLGIGQDIALVPTLADPKDLFGLLHTEPPTPLRAMARSYLAPMPAELAEYL